MLMIKHLLIVALLTCCMPLIVNGVGYATAAEVVNSGFNDISIFFDGSNLRVTNASGLNLYVYSITGVRIMSVKVDGDDKLYKINLQRGCYIVKVGNVVRKISIK